MKVLIIGSRVPWPLNDGGAIASYNLLKGLSLQGVEVHYLSLNTKKHFVDALNIQKEFSFLKSIKCFDIDTSISPIKAFINLFKRSSYNIDRFTSAQFAQLIQATIAHEKFDLLHFEGLFVAQYIEMIQVNSPTLLRQHNIEHNIWETLAKTSQSLPKKMYLNFLAKRMKTFESQIIPLFDGVVCITQDDLNFVNQLHYKGEHLVIPAGIEIHVPTKVAIDAHTVYHIGSMEWMPNQEAMHWFHEEIWPKVVFKNGDLKFYMAGKNMPELYKKWNSRQFVVLGEVENQDQFKADKSILVVPLKSGSGIRIKTIEAMLARKAVVSTSQGALGLPIQHLEHCLIADTAEDFAKAILSLAELPELRQRLCEDAYQLAASRYSNEAVSKQWTVFYTMLIRQAKTDSAN